MKACNKIFKEQSTFMISSVDEERKKKTKRKLSQSNADECFIYGLQILIHRRTPNRICTTILMEMTRKLLFTKFSITKLHQEKMVYKYALVLVALFSGRLMNALIST